MADTSITIKIDEQKEYEYCIRCGRKLKNPETRQRGFGHICESKMKVERRKKLFPVNYKK